MEQLMNELPQLLNQLGEKLGVAGSKIWEWSLLDVKVSLYKESICLLVGLFGILIACVILYKCYKKTREDGDVFIFAFGLFILLSCGSLFLGSLFGVIEYSVNPEWAAFKNIITQLNTLK